MFNELDSTSTNSPVYRAGIPYVTTLFQREKSMCDRSQLSPRNRLQRSSFFWRRTEVRAYYGMGIYFS